MIYLILVSFIWGFSFGLIKGNLTSLDPNFVSWARMVISLLVFLPFLRIKNISWDLLLKLILIGAVQYGLMYITYIFSYRFLEAYQVALFTIFTPIYVTLINDTFLGKLNLVNLSVAIITVFGTGIIIFQQISLTNFWKGFILMQISNLCFAFGQIYYRECTKKLKSVKDHEFFVLLYFGAVILTTLATGLSTHWIVPKLTVNQISTLLYLGMLASGLCFFWWNLGARQVNGGTLAIINNLKIPLAIIISLIFFHEKANVTRLLIGGGMILLSLIFSEKKKMSNIKQ
jgi:drug/metabolite transporter (DMT)-like permease